MKLSIAIAILLVAVVVGGYFILRSPTTPSGPTTITGDELAILSDQINSLTNEQLAAISTDMSDFSTTADGEISQDTGLFYYE